MAYTFTCPLDTCNHQVMTSQAANSEEAAKELTGAAEKHLQEIHPDVRKTHEEVDQDIRSHMVGDN